MVISGVKRKFPVAIALAGLAVATALSSWDMIFPPRLVETVYSRRLFPTISHIASWFADSVPFSWVDVWMLVGVFTVVFSVRQKNWRFPLALISAAYLIFFWGWGLNYQRSPIEIRMGLKGCQSLRKRNSASSCPRHTGGESALDGSCRTANQPENSASMELRRRPGP
jgi:hypothetical protein